MKRIAVAVVSIGCLFFVSSASAQTVITQAKALAGGITPGDAAGYPITISQPGAYRLDSNLSVPAGAYGIYVSANNVDIDLNGFTLTGNSTGTWGVISNSGESRIHNGIINLFRYSGIYLRNTGWVIESMQVMRNGTLGIDATGAASISVRSSFVEANGGIGVRVGEDSRIETSNISRNRSDGVYCEAGCYVAESTVNSNSGNGIWVAGNGGTVIGNIIRKNTGFGLNATNPEVTLGVSVGFGNNTIFDNTVGSYRGIVTGFNPNYCSPAAC